VLLIIRNELHEPYFVHPSILTSKKLRNSYIFQRKTVPRYLWAGKEFHKSCIHLSVGLTARLVSNKPSRGKALEPSLGGALFEARPRHWLPGLVRWDFVMDKSVAGAGFLRELRFPLPIYIPSASLQSSSLSPEAGTIGQELPQCQ
jgi:hypothetical protein